MPEITDAEYQEYVQLKARAERLAVLVSLSQVVGLEDDVDEPIKRCVAALALLGCSPRWSCCGFDYAGQPLHKHHQYGRIYFILDKSSEPFAEMFCALCPDWQLSLVDGHVDLHVDVQNVIAQWDNPICVHYHEGFVGYIQALEEFLYWHSVSFAEEVVLCDTNGPAKEKYRHWQYPVMADWVIRRSDYI